MTFWQWLTSSKAERLALRDRRNDAAREARVNLIARQSARAAESRERSRARLDKSRAELDEARARSREKIQGRRARRRERFGRRRYP